MISVVFLGCLLMGCNYNTPTTQDEQRDPYFLLGNNRAKSLDFVGATEAFLKALEVNPRSASAHYELANLYEGKINEPARAIYHYERFLQYQPKADNADIIRAHITACKQELAKSLSIGPLTPNMQYKMDKLVAENLQLRQTLDSVQRRLTIATNMMTPQALAWLANQVTNLPPSTLTNTASTKGKTVLQANVAGVSKTYIVRSGDTPALIAKRHNMRVQALLNANPGLDARKLKVGQTLNIPTP
jgi:LysM repeat protein